MESSKSISYWPFSKKTIRNLLIVEDSDTDYLLTRRKMIKLLEPVTIERARNRSELIRALLSQYDLIVTDLHLGDIDDGELLRAIHNAQPASPCLILTGSTMNLAVPTFENVIGVLEKGDQRGLETICSDLSAKLNE